MQKYCNAALISLQEKRKRHIPTPRALPATGCVEVEDAGQEAEDSATASPTKDHYKKLLHASTEKVTQLQKKVKILQQNKRRLSRRNEVAEEIMKKLKEKNLLSEEGTEVVAATFSPEIQQLLCRAQGEQKGKYPSELRAFALTLHFYSPAAYEYVRSKFNGALPAPRTLREWYRSVDGEPGFTAESFSFLEQLVKSVQNLHCALIVDDMAIRKQIELVGNKVVGYVDLGTGMQDDSIPEAKNACVYMLVGLNMRLKLPVGYFLIDSLTGSERAELTRQCIDRLEAIGVQVVSLTFDGAASNFTMARCLGADLQLSSEHFTTSFKNPGDSSKLVYVMLDPCHMIKLIRNSLATVSHLVDGDGRFVKWAYVKALDALQREEGMRLGNKLTSGHVQWERQKMKVRLAVQVLSASVADALVFCEHELKLPQFRGASATAKFIRVFDHLFDILNSRNHLAKSFKAPLRKQNKNCWMSHFDEARRYIMTLKDPAGRPVLESPKKTGFLGFIVCMQSIEQIFDRLVVHGTMGYILTHKMSQDHVETFFGCIRGRGGFNNNPTAAQFTASYKRLLVHTEVTSSSAGNCSPDLVSILSKSASILKVEDTDTTVARRSIMQPEDHDYTHRLDIPESLSSFSQSVVPYIAGFVARSLGATSMCEECVMALQTEEQPALVKHKNRGGLTSPSDDVVSICTAAEKGLRRLQAECTTLKALHSRSRHLVLEILGLLPDKQWFSSLNEHILDSDALDNHIYKLCKNVVELYMKIRIHHMIKEKNRKMTADKVRAVLTKLILFKNQ
ncbi:hypothetical protein MTO96_033152 [Rhipicephalus appendiculatus]